MKQDKGFAVPLRCIFSGLPMRPAILRCARFGGWCCLMLIVVFLFPLWGMASGTNPPSLGFDPDKVSSRLLLMENKGQVTDLQGNLRPDVLFLGQNGGMKVAIRTTGISFQFEKREAATKALATFSSLLKDTAALKPTMTETYRIDLDLIGSNTAAEVTHGPVSGYYENYYNTPHAPEGILEVQSYEAITLVNVYPGIDWKIYSQTGALKYDFVVHPGADPRMIRLHYAGATDVSLLADGKLKIGTPMGEIVEDAPVSFLDNGAQVDTKFNLENGELTFDIAVFDSTETLVIDPLLVWATYNGGAGNDNGISMATFGGTNIYIAGQTSSTNAISQGGHQNTFGGYSDAFIAKFDTNGIRIWASYYGGMETDAAYGAATDPFGNVYIAGNTSSWTGIGAGGHQNTFNGSSVNAFLVKFNDSGLRLWGTYYGGNGSAGGGRPSTDALGNVFLVGNTYSTSGIAAGGYQNTSGGDSDCFLVKFNAAGVRLWATYLGGTQFDYLTHSATDVSGNVYVAGGAASSSGIALGGHQNTYGGNSDLILAKFNGLGALLWCTYYGDTSLEDTPDVTIDAQSNVYLIGQTNSPANIASGGHQNQLGGQIDIFLAKFHASGNRLWATYYGDTLIDNTRAVITDAASNVYLVGFTRSSRFIASGGYQNTLLSMWGDAFIAKFDPAGTRIWGTYFGFPMQTQINGIRVIPSNSIFVCGPSALQTNMNGGPHQPVYGGGIYDSFLAKITQGPCTSPPAATGAVNASYCEGNPIPTLSVAIPAVGDSVVWHTASVGGAPAVGTILGTRGSSFRPTNPATFTYYAATTRINLPCVASTRIPVTLTQNLSPSVIASSNSPVCQGDTLNLSVVVNSSYAWSGPAGFNATNQFPSIPNFGSNMAGNYFITVTGGNGCTATDTLAVNFLPTPATPSGANDGSYCIGDPVPSLTVAAPPVGQTVYWFAAPVGGGLASGTVSGIRGNTFLPTSGATATYYAETLDVGGCISASRTPVTLTLNSLPTLVTSSNAPVCMGDTIFLNAAGGNIYAWNGPNGFSSTLQNPFFVLVDSTLLGSYGLTATDSNGCANSTALVVTTLPPVIADFSFVQNPGSGLDWTFSDASSGNPTAWEWEFGDGTTSNLQNPSHTYTASGNYNVQLIATDSCGHDTLLQNIGVVGTAAAIIPVITISPNPCNGNFQIETSGWVDGEAFVEITNMHGQLILQRKVDIHSGQFQFDISLGQVAGGTYFVKISNAGQSVVKKLMVL
ncbi:MAG: T9SS type A sorting domain-containing protein [Bacteroidetes bacterium]|nr:T9SS type A sorting domain-containing protein [Bacteroidota bacterium]